MSLINQRYTLCRPRSTNVRVLLFPFVFPNYVFYVPNPCVLGTRLVLHVTAVSLSWQEHKACQSYGTVTISLPLVAHRWNRSGEIRVLRISQCSICFPWGTDAVCTLLFRNKQSFHASKSDSHGNVGVFRPTSGSRGRRGRRGRRKISEYSLASLGIIHNSCF